MVKRGTSVTTGSHPQTEVRPGGGARRSPAPLGRIRLWARSGGCARASLHHRLNSLIPPGWAESQSGAKDVGNAWMAAARLRNASALQRSPHLPRLANHFSRLQRNPIAPGRDVRAAFLHRCPRHRNQSAAGRSGIGGREFRPMVAQQMRPQGQWLGIWSAPAGGAGETAG